MSSKLDNPVYADECQERELLFHIWRHAVSFYKTNKLSNPTGRLFCPGLLGVFEDMERNWGQLSNDTITPPLHRLLEKGYLEISIPDWRRVDFPFMLHEPFEVIPNYPWSYCITTKGIEVLQQDRDLKARIRSGVPPTEYALTEDGKLAPIPNWIDWTMDIKLDACTSRNDQGWSDTINTEPILKNEIDKNRFDKASKLLNEINVAVRELGAINADLAIGRGLLWLSSRTYEIDRRTWPDYTYIITRKTDGELVMKYTIFRNANEAQALQQTGMGEIHPDEHGTFLTEEQIVIMQCIVAGLENWKNTHHKSAENSLTASNQSDAAAGQSKEMPVGGLYGTDRDMTLEQVQDIVKQCLAYKKRGGTVTEFHRRWPFNTGKFELGTLRHWLKQDKFRSHT